MSWATIFVLALGAYGFKLAGVVVGRLSTDRSDSATEVRPGPATRIGRLLPPALLTALVVSQTVTSGRDLTIDARLAGVAAGGLAVAFRAPFWVTVIVAAAVTAGLRAAVG